MWFLEEMVIYYLIFIYIIAISEMIDRKKRKKKK